jgi:hypothetical protein
MALYHCFIIAAGSVDIALLPKPQKKDSEESAAAVADLPPTVSSPAVATGVAPPSPRKTVPSNPQSQPDNVCFFKVRQQKIYVYPNKTI